MAVVLAFFAVVCCVVATFSCRFILIKDDTTVGFRCEPNGFRSQNDEERWNVAEALGLTATFGGLVALVCSCALVCNSKPKFFVLILSVTYTGLAIITTTLVGVGLTVDVYGVSTDSQRPGGSAFMAMVGILLYLGAAYATATMNMFESDRPDSSRNCVSAFCSRGLLLGRTIPTSLSGMACVMTMAAVTHCNFATRDYYGDRGMDRLGYITHAYSDDACEFWDASEKSGLVSENPVAWDFAWKAGMAVGFIAGYGGCIVLLVCLCCVEISPVTRRNEAALDLLFALLSSLMLVGFKSRLCTEPSVSPQERCDLGSGAKLAIVASVFYFGAGISVLFLRNKESVRVVEGEQHSSGSSSSSSSDRSTQGTSIKVEDAIENAT